MGDGTRPGCDINHYHCHRYTPLQKVRSRPGHSSYGMSSTGDGTFKALLVAFRYGVF